MNDLSTWPTKPEAAARLGISERSLERLVEQGKPPERRMRQRPGKRPEPVFNPEEVEMLEIRAFCLQIERKRLAAIAWELKRRR